jgi:hypothetical protein
MGYLCNLLIKEPRPAKEEEMVLISTWSSDPVAMSNI